MKVLEKFYNIWKDLEKSYELMGVKLKASNRSEFLKALCYDNSGTCIIPTMKMALLSEIESYSEEEKSTHSLLVEIMDSFSFLLSSGDLNLDTDEIEDLNILMMSAVKGKNEATLVKNMTVSSLIESFSFLPEIVELSSCYLFSKYGEVDSFCKMYRGKAIVVKLKETLDNNFICLNNEVVDVLEQFLKKEESNKVFLKKVITVLNKLESANVSELEQYAISDRANLKDGKLLGRVIKETNSKDLVLYKDIKIILV